jgi:hypothetical protein
MGGYYREYPPDFFDLVITNGELNKNFLLIGLCHPPRNFMPQGLHVFIPYRRDEDQK